MNPLNHAIYGIQWYEGMLLTPQHFQQHGCRLEFLFYQHLRMITPYFWGLSKLVIDEILFASGKLRISEFEGVFSDGTFVRIDPQGPIIPELDLTPYIDQLRSGKILKVYFVLPYLNSDGKNVTGDFPRYISVPGNAVVDLDTGENPIYVQLLVPKVSLIVDTPSPRYASIPLMEVVFQNETYQRTSFIPPQMVITQASVLGQVIASIILSLRDKAAFLSESLQTSSLATGSVAQRNEDLLKIIVRQVPHLENILGGEATHPYVFYNALLQLAGDLTALKRGQIAPLFKPYKHEEIFDTFDQVVTFIIQMIDLIQKNYTVISFKQFNQVFSIQPPSQIFEGANFILSLRGTQTFGAPEILQWANNAIIASESCLKSVRDRRILGADRQLIETNTDFGVSSPPDGILLSVKNDPDFIKSGDVLCLMNLGDTPETRPQEILLYAKNM